MTDLATQDAAISGKGDAVAPVDGAGGQPSGLKRSMGLFGVLMITLSAISPASSVFIIVPGIFATGGSGALIAMAVGALVGLCMSFVYAELASAFPLSGGEYAIVGRILGPFAGFVVLGVGVMQLIAIPAVMAVGIGVYLDVLVPGAPPVAAAVLTVALAAGVCVLHLRASAVVTGAFLAVELLALAALAALGFFHAVRPLSEVVLHPVFLDTTGTLSAVPPTLIAMAVSLSIFSYNGYGSAVYFGEETYDASRHIGRTVLLALLVTVICEIVPVIAVLLGAPDLRTFFSSHDMMGVIFLSYAGPIANVLVSFCLVLAILNAVIANLLMCSRQLYSIGRDRILPARLSDGLTVIHPRFNSPWGATFAAGALSGAACLISEQMLLIITGSGILVMYMALCLAVIVGRRNGLTAGGHYRMPLFPLPPLLAFLAMVGVTGMNWMDAQVGRPSLVLTLFVALGAGAYYLLVLSRRGWRMQGPQS